MKFTTITYDANLPTVQQVNVPTNSDYKVGMKVKRNGEVQRLSHSDFTITDPDGNTLSVDSEKTNGYVTITKDSGDSASFTQLDVRVDKNYAGFGPDEASNFGVKLTSSLGRIQLTTSAEVLAPCVGKPILSENVKMEYSLDGQNWKDIDNTKMGSYMDFYVKVGDAYPFQYKLDERKWLDLRGATTQDEAKRLDSLTFEEGWSMYNNPVTGSKFPPACPDFSGSLTSSNPLYIRVRFLLGDGETHQTFKLNLNAHKSQKGDINLVSRASTVNLAGTDGQGKAFSYDIITK